MSPAGAPTRRQQSKPKAFAAVGAAARLHLCAVTEDPEVRTRHVAALLAFTPTVHRLSTRMLISFEHGPTALWVSEVLDKDAVLLELSPSRGVVEVVNPQIVLGRYGFRGGRWVFGRGVGAALGISRGAVHAAGVFNGHGLKVGCPTAPMMLTLTAVMARLGINAKPTEGEPRAAISASDVPAALDRLGIAEVTAQYRGLRETNVMGDQS